MKKCSEQGRTMIEVIGVLAILTAVSVAINKFINNMHDKFKISRITQQSTDLRKNISNRYVANGDYTVIKAQDHLIWWTMEKLFMLTMLKSLLMEQEIHIK